MFRTRQYVVVGFTIAILFSLLIKLSILQIFQFDRYSDMASEQHKRVFRVEPKRGTIFDRYREPLAINLDAASVWCDPRGIEDKEGTASALADILGIDRDLVLRRLLRDKAFVWIRRKIRPEEEKRIRQLDLRGVYLTAESKRIYPNDSMASHVIGFVGVDNDGLEGMERFFDASLKGRHGLRHLVRDARKMTVLFNENDSVPPRNGQNLVLTIDTVIQYIAEEELRVMAEEHNAAGATAIVMDPHTGEVLAMANYPDYDLNAFYEAPRSLLKNAAVSSVYEPGSVFKVVTASAALNEGGADPDEKIGCENGEYSTGGRVLHDYHSYGDLTFRDIIAKSSNIGTVKVAERLGGETLYEYISKFGFGRKTGIDLPGEVEGISRPPSVWSRSDITTIPIGQGIAVTPIQLACAVSVIANGGYLVKPRVVSEVTTWEGNTYKVFGPERREMVLEKSTCDLMKEILRRVVTDGTGRRARSKTYDICGKTGTAQMVNPAGGYYKNKYDATFIGFAPVEDPVVSIVVVAHDPHPVHFGGSVAGPAFRKIAERTLQYLGNKRN